MPTRGNRRETQSTRQTIQSLYDEYQNGGTGRLRRIVQEINVLILRIVNLPVADTKRASSQSLSVLRILVRTVDGIGRPMADLNVCDGHAGQLVQRPRMKKLEASM